MKSKGEYTACIAIVLICLTVNTKSQIACSSNCTSITPNAVCGGSGYCECSPGYIFDCNTKAAYIPSSSYLSPLSLVQPNYYILTSQVGVQLQYTVSFEDQSNTNILKTYQPNFLTDQGMTLPPQSSYLVTSYKIQPNSFQCIFTITLTNQPGTNLPQRLILLVNVSNSYISPSLRFSYTYTKPSNSTSIFLIMGYVAGGLLIATSVLFIVLIYRKKRNPRPPRNGQDPTKFDISHFPQLMPQRLVSVEEKKNLSACAVCLLEFDFNSLIRMTVCQHMFHCACIDEWCIKNLNCPMCRTVLTRDQIIRIKAEKVNDNSLENDWIINSLHEDEEPSEIRNPFNQSSINNSRL